MLRTLALGLLALTAASSFAIGQAVESVYTKFDTKTCKKQKSGWVCAGHDGNAVRVTVGDQRMQISYGKTGKHDRARSQSLPGFNNAYEGTVEWRVEKTAAGKTKPFATILRWNAISEKDQENATGPITATGRILVVTKVGPDGVCHVGYVDAVANPDANELARKLADEKARDFKCGVDKRVVVGKKGNVPLPDGEV
ncbi:hypothetical protein GJW-30_1_04383 [Variibacter gotjawalensis]|uniref:Uncharacterized protein n=1 Tax=Variibacter gotjawalensis TaxID=1333996 RepID=A0A0S3Q0Z6_9BRAD|nr:hypothetical protein [Variibacter gotjawalensis]NIK47662.1 hypothetical protein [Variibacter gotjawalensis]RZS49559.1 hypothetical protein EV661_1993 [Variibacter gotjawalensis]BAT61822.1 hypothetical protein GJW-30_1_04383 [Variibacter gotjawalensis]